MPQISRSAAALAVFALTLLALAFRLAGIGFGLPHGSLGDECVYSEFMRWMVGPSPPDPAQFEFYPHLVPRIALLLRPEPRTELTTLADHLARAASDLVLVRVVVACLSVLAVPATYLLARRFFGRPASVLAAALTSTSFLGLWFSQQARPHGALMGLGALSLVASLEVRRRGGLRAWLLAALACAAAVCTLQTGIFWLGPLVAAYLLPARRSGGRAHLLLLASLVLIALSVRVFYPFLFSVAASADHTPHPLAGHALLGHLTGKGILSALRGLWDYEPWLGLWSVIGLLVLCATSGVRIAPGALRFTRSREWIADPRAGDLVVLAAFALPYCVLLGLYDRTHERYLLPILPLLACAAAGGLERACAYAVNRRGPLFGRVFTRVGVALFAIQALFALALCSARATNDTLQRAADWITANVPRGNDRIVVTPGFELPLLRDESAVSWLKLHEDSRYNVWLAYQDRLEPGVRASLGLPLIVPPVRTREDRIALQEHPENYLDSVAADYVVLYLPDRSPLFASIREGARKRGILVERFSPWRFDGGDEHAFLPNEWGDPFLLEGNWVWHALRARCCGPVLEIYHLDRRGG